MARFFGNPARRRAAVGFTAAAASAVLGLSVTSPAQASVGTLRAAVLAPVTTVPATWTPQVGDDSTVRQLTPCGPTMYAAGSFSSVTSANGAPQTFTRHNVFSFNASTGAISTWAPNVNGTVNTIALSTDCSIAYIGGVFSTINGVTAKNVAAVSTATGSVISTFDHNAAGQVETILVYQSHVLVGGYFKSINGSSANPYFTSLSSATGKDDGYLHLQISGNYVFPGVNQNPTRVYNTDVSHDGTKALVMGDFTSVGGLHREQIFMLDLTTGTVTGWTSDAFYQPCGTTEPYYLQAAAWSPDDSTIYVDTTGFKPYNKGTGGTRTGLCDAAAAFSALPVNHASWLWINYTGCDSLFAITADSTTVYVGGHQRWLNNPKGCDAAGPGALSSPGVGGLNPQTGFDPGTWNPGRSRGHGADDMFVTSAGLWIASDTFLGATSCAHKFHPGICFFPY